MDPAPRKGLNLALLAVERRKALAEKKKLPLPSPPRDPKRRKTPIRVHIGGTPVNPPMESEASLALGTDPEKRKRKRSKETTQAPEEAIHLSPDPQEPVLALPGDDRPYTELDDEVLSKRLQNATRHLVSDKDIDYFQSLPREEKLKDCKAICSQFLIRTQLLLSEPSEEEEMNRLVETCNRRSERIKTLREELKKERQAREESEGQMTALKDELKSFQERAESLTKELEDKTNELANKQTIALEWLETPEGKQRDLMVNADSYDKGIRVTELSFQLAWEQNPPNDVGFEEFRSSAYDFEVAAIEAYEKENEGSNAAAGEVQIASEGAQGEDEA